MSAGEVLGGAVLAVLEGLGVSVFDAPPVRGAVPYAVVGEAECRAIDAVGLTARQARIAVELVDGGERPVRLRALQGEAEERVLGLRGELGEGWRLVAIALARSRVTRAGDTRWRGTAEFLAVLHRLNS
jgi:hypothetical protein